jgi:hypothetical protein
MPDDPTPPRFAPRLAEEDIAGGQLFGKAIERALEREIRWKDEEEKQAGSSPVPPKGEPSDGSWRDRPSML